MKSSAAEQLGSSNSPSFHDQLSSIFSKSEAGKIELNIESLARLKRELFWTLGERRAQGVFARWGISCGLAATTKKIEDSALLKSLGQISYGATPSANEYVFDIKNSCEANAAHSFLQAPIKSHQCWMIAGFLTGALSGKLEQPVYFLEVMCNANNESACRFIGKPKDEWASEAAEAIAYYEEDNMALELTGTREQLKFTKERYQNLFEQSSMPVFIIDPDTSAILNANLAAEDLTGYKKTELINKNLFDIQPNEEHQNTVAAIKKLLSGEPVDDYEAAVVHKSGEKKIIAQSSKVLSYGGQRVIQTIMRNITDLKVSEKKESELQQQLLRSERLSSIGRLAANVAHELKNPLGAIRNAIYYIRDALKSEAILTSDPHLKKIIRLAESEVDGAVTIIGDLVDFARVIQIIPRKTMINELLEEMPSIVPVPNNIKIEWDLDITLPSAMVDSDRLKQVFTNIMNNGLQAMPQGGTLIIRTRYEVETDTKTGASTKMITVTFKDSGVGIESMHLAKIFEPLFTTKARGTGLGLAISRNIVEKHGGVIRVTSQKDKGTSFSIKFPLKPPQKKG